MHHPGGDVANGGSRAYVGRRQYIRKVFIFFSVCCEVKTALKNKVSKKLDVGLP